MATPAKRRVQSPQDAELLAQEWMRYFGYRDAAVTPPGADMGFDVTSAKAVAQVTFWTTKKVGRPDIHMLRGAMLRGAAKRKAVLLFSLSGYSRPAEEWAKEENIALFVFDRSGSVEPVNHRATQIVRGAQNLGPPLTDRQILITQVAGWTIGVAIATLILTLGLSSFRSTPEGCYPLVNPSSQACDRAVGGPLALIIFLPPIVLGVAALLIPPALRSIWQYRIDKNWRKELTT